MAGAQLTYYQILQISPTAGAAEIKAAYRRAARRTHPDYGGDAEHFRRVTEAYQVLSEPESRRRYDTSYSTFRPAGSTTMARPAPAAGSGDFGARQRSRPNTPAAGGLPIFVPPFDSRTPPPLPLELASAQAHGEPRKRGIFSATARLERERRTAELLTRQILARFPSARLINGVESPVSKVPLEHVVLVGYRMAVISSIQVPPGAYRWNGISLRNGSHSIEPPKTLAAARALGQLFPDCTVTAWTILLGPANSHSEPAIDYASRAAPGGEGHSLIAARGVARDLGGFLAAGAEPNVVDLQILARLLAAMT